MSVLSFDGGAKRCGWAHIDHDPKAPAPSPLLHDSGILGLDREHNGKKVPYQEFRLALIDYWLDNAYRLILNTSPETVVTETVPTVGGGNFVVAADSQLVATVVTTIQAVAKLEGINVVQIAANTVQKNIGIGKTPAGKVSKQRVRNGVLKLIPELESRRSEFVDVFDETDAIAIGLCYLGYRVEGK